MIKAFPLLALGAIFHFSLGACSNPSVKLTRQPLTGGPIAKVLLNPDQLTPKTRAYLESRDLLSSYHRDPVDTISIILAGQGTSPSKSEQITLIELYSDTAEKLAPHHPHQAVAYHLAAAELAFPDALRSKDDGKENQFRITYNHSSSRVAQILFNKNHQWKNSLSLKGPDKTYHLSCQTSGKGLISPGFFDEFVPTDYLKFDNIEMKRNVQAGVGGSMLGHRKGTAERREANPFLPPNAGMSLPVNATLEFAKNGSEVTLSFFDLLESDSAKLAGTERQLAADFTAPLATLYNHQKTRNLGLKALLHPDEYVKEMGLLQLEPFRTDQIPVVLVHGLMSSPATWVDTLNGLRADPVLRDRYQLFAFRYPTGFPIARNAAALRKHIKEFQEFHDPNRSNPNMRNMIFIGHSMGGILTNAQIRDSGETITSQLFDRPIENLTGLTSEEKNSIKDMAVYRANPDIRRVIYLASPHRGSDLSIGTIGSLGRKLISFPSKLLTGIKSAQVEGITAFGQKLINSRPDSIESLHPDSAVLTTILSQPVYKGVKIHSIIGNHKLTSPLKDSSDTVVPYWSAHLSDAVSEKVVNAKHTTITHDPEAIEELRRILYLHADESYSQPTSADRR